MRDFRRTMAALLAASLATGITASIVQTQINLKALASLGAPITLLIRLTTTLEDLSRFGPVMAGISGAALVPALLMSDRAMRVVPSAWRTGVPVLAGVAGLCTAFVVMGLVTPMPALIAAVRGPVGLALMSATGAVGGLAYAWMARPASTTRAGRGHAMLSVALVAVPGLSFAMTAPGSAMPTVPVDPAGYVVQTVATGIDHPWAMAVLPDGRVLVTEKRGRLHAMLPDGRREEIRLAGLPTMFSGGENGLLDVVPDPDFVGNGLLYLTMTYGEGGAIGTRLVRARLAGDRITDVRVLFSSRPGSSDSNKGGRVVVLRDGTLVLSIGDGNDTRERAQDPESALGKLVRIDREGRVPPDNPFAARGGTTATVYSSGHRHAQGLVVDPADGSLLVSDHGPRGGDEIGRIRPGGNHGWPVVTGGIDYSFARVTPFRTLDRYEAPLLDWTPSIAPAGLTVYDGEMFPAWRGDLLVPALKDRSIRRVIRRDGRIVDERSLLAELDLRIRDVKTAPDGSILALTDGSDAGLLRIVPAIRKAARITTASASASRRRNVPVHRADRF